MPNFFRTVAGFAAGGPVGAAYEYNQQKQASQRSSQQQIAGQQQELQGLNWDPNTFMPTNLGHAPTANQAINADWQSQQIYQQQKNRYFQDALGSNQQALSTLGGYRSGGAASAAAGILQNRSSLQFNIGNSLERPDFFANARQAAQNAALSAQKHAANMQLLGGVLQAGAGIAGMAMGAPALPMMMGGAGAAAGAMGGARAGQQPMQAGVAPSQSPGGGQQQGAVPQSIPMGLGGDTAMGARSGGAGGGPGGGGGGGPAQGAQQVTSATPLDPVSMAVTQGAVSLMMASDGFYSQMHAAVGNYSQRAGMAA